MTDPKLVEALAEVMYSVDHWDIGWDDADASDRDECISRARAFLTDHRLVQLPEEPGEWEVQWGPDEWIGFQTMEDAVNFANENRPSTTGRIRAVYDVVKYSDPQEVKP